MSISPGWCVMCKNDNESADHLFLHCPLAQRVWSYVLQKFKVSWVLPQGVNQLIEADFMMHRDKKTNLLWSLVIHAVLWSLWKERNLRIFEEKEGSLANIIEAVYYWVALWASVHKELSQFPFKDWLRGWDFLLL